MTLLVLMLVSSWSVPADAGLLDRLCRIGRARTTACRPVQKQGLLGRLFRCKEKRLYQAPPPNGGLAGCPTEKVLELMDENDNCVFSVYKMTNCISRRFWITAMPCGVEAEYCYGWVCSDSSVTAIEPVTVEVVENQPLDYYGVDNLGYSTRKTEVDFKATTLKPVTFPNYTASPAIRVRIRDLQKNEYKTYDLFRVTGFDMFGDKKTMGFGVEVKDDPNAISVEEFNVFKTESGVLKFQQKLNGGNETWFYLVYPSK